MAFYAHNGGGYDFKFIWMGLFLQGYKPYSIIERGGKIIYFKVRFNKKSFIEFRDSYAILPSSLRKLAKSFDVETQKGEIDYDKEFDVKKWEEYNARDLLALEQVLDKYKKLLNVNKLEKTTASQAMCEFKKICPFEFEFQKGEGEVREGYYGGRVEIFKTFDYDLKCYDVNSLFPYVMQKFEYPFGDYFYTRKEYGHGVWRAKVKTPNLHIPLLPVRINGKLYFPTGEFEGWWTYPELEKAKEEGYSVEIIEGYGCFDIQKPFKPFVDKWYTLKLKAEREGNEPLRYVSKLLMNSLYGKFGQRREKTTIKCVETIEEGDIVIDDNFQLVERKSVNYFSTFVNPMIAAYVTSYARIHLYDLLKQCGEDVAYCDTDSVYTTKTLRTGSELGSLKLESEIEEAKFRLPKLYTYKNIKGEYVIKSKGMPGLDAFKVHSGEEIESYAKTLVGWRESFARGMELTQIIERKRKVLQIYDKRKVLENGKTTPYAYEEIKRTSAL